MTSLNCFKQKIALEHQTNTASLPDGSHCPNAHHIGLVSEARSSTMRLAPLDRSPCERALSPEDTGPVLAPSLVSSSCMEGFDWLPRRGTLVKTVISQPTSCEARREDALEVPTPVSPSTPASIPITSASTHLRPVSMHFVKATSLTSSYRFRIANSLSQSAGSPIHSLRNCIGGSSGSNNGSGTTPVAVLPGKTAAIANSPLTNRPPDVSGINPKVNSSATGVSSPPPAESPSSLASKYSSLPAPMSPQSKSPPPALPAEVGCSIALPPSGRHTQSSPCPSSTLSGDNSSFLADASVEKERPLSCLVRRVAVSRSRKNGYKKFPMEEDDIEEPPIPPSRHDSHLHGTRLSPLPGLLLGQQCHFKLPNATVQQGISVSGEYETLGTPLLRSQRLHTPPPLNEASAFSVPAATPTSSGYHQQPQQYSSSTGGLVYQLTTRTDGQPAYRLVSTAGRTDISGHRKHQTASVAGGADMNSSAATPHFLLVI
ncbi:unnamed protein product [Protopolystoma xenopodis]|uniref:Uncharacterized protein n=1 Tax=Protopolystoma xenopodis TaxID=117903 RepID=A0A3S5B7V8_9PLAT|nr:unnamed protein product [Protopolystoma xenopodis]